MSEPKTLYKILLSSPDDVQYERNIMDQIVDELNKTLGSSHNVMIELVKFETDTYPSIGNDPQDVINKQIGEDYDIFVGIFWKKFGTPTPRAGSGTEEEFNNAYNKYKNEPTKVKIMIYFNHMPIPFDEISPEDITLIKDFKNKLRDKGVLYYYYNNHENFESSIRIHLYKAIFDLIKTTTSKRVDRKVEETVPSKQDEELGIYDYSEIAEIKNKQLIKIIERIKEIISLITSKIGQKSTEIKELKKKYGQIDNKEAEEILGNLASELGIYAQELYDNKIQFRDAISSYVEAHTKLITLMIKNQTVTVNDLNVYMKELHGLRTSLSQSKSMFSIYRDLFKNIPSLTKDIIKFRIKFQEALSMLIEEHDYAISLISELEQFIKEFKDEFLRRAASMSF